MENILMPQQSFELKNNLPSMTVIRLYSSDLQLLSQALKDKIKTAPMMFVGLQVIVDLSSLIQDDGVFDFSAMKTVLLNQGVNPVAIMSDNKQYREQAILAGLGALPYIEHITGKKLKSKKIKSATVEIDAKAQQQNTDKDEPSTLEDSEPKKTYTDNYAQPDNNEMERLKLENQIVSHPIRSGQRVYCKGDLTIIGTVSPGAEVIANGNIHIYGSLRGRALAGAKGNEQAKIFCQNMDAELVSIAGSYKQMEEIDSQYRHKPIQISLESEKICFFPL